MSYITNPPFDMSVYRNKAVTNGVAGIYNPCKTILNEHRPVCTKEYHLTGKYLDGADNPDVWFPITAGTGSMVYNARYLTITSSTGGTAANRVVIDQTTFPIAGNFAEVTCKIGTVVNGVDGSRSIAIGFAASFSSLHQLERAIFVCGGDGGWGVAFRGDSVLLSTLPIGRNLVAGDIVTVRLDRQEGSTNIDIARFYVNGQKQYETTNIPAVDCYAGIGVFNDASVTVARSFSTDYFGVKYVP